MSNEDKQICFCCGSTDNASKLCPECAAEIDAFNKTAENFVPISPEPICKRDLQLRLDAWSNSMDAAFDVRRAECTHDANTLCQHKLDDAIYQHMMSCYEPIPIPTCDDMADATALSFMQIKRPSLQELQDAAKKAVEKEAYDVSQLHKGMTWAEHQAEHQAERNAAIYGWLVVILIWSWIILMEVYR